MRVLQRGARLPTGVDDGLRVAQVRPLGVLLEAVRSAAMTSPPVLGQHAPGGVVLGREDQDLVDATGRGLGEDRPPVGHHKGLVALKGG